MLAHCELQIGIDCIKDVSYLKLKVHVGSIILLLVFLPPISPEAYAADFLCTVLVSPSFYEPPRVSLS